MQGVHLRVGRIARGGIRASDRPDDFRAEIFGLMRTQVVKNALIVPAGAKGGFTLVFLASPADIARAGGLPDGRRPTEMDIPMIEITHNWDEKDYAGGRNFGHIAYRVDDIYAATRRLADLGIIINRPPRDGRMTFIRSPDGISVELLQKGEALAPEEPWASAPNVGVW
jgi:lactoylglutathione lyase